MTSNPTRTYALGQAFKFPGKGYRFQNFNVGGKVSVEGTDKRFEFLPFGFSGVTVSRSGDNIDASIALPNNALAQAFALEAFEEEWECVVYVGNFDVAAPDQMEQILYEYVGVVASGGWDETAIRMTLNSVLDAVTGDVPHRVFEADNVGPLPITASIQLQ